MGLDTDNLSLKMVRIFANHSLSGVAVVLFKAAVGVGNLAPSVLLRYLDLAFCIGIGRGQLCPASQQPYLGGCYKARPLSSQCFLLSRSYFTKVCFSRFILGCHRACDNTVRDYFGSNVNVFQLGSYHIR